MSLDPDELAGVVDLFGALTRDELERALAELAFKRGDDPPPPDVVDDALAAYALAEYDDGDRTLLVPGPAAFPALPAGATDLPHILDVTDREVDRDVLGRRVEERFRADVARAVAADDADRVAHLLDVSYDVETWAPVDLGDLRERLDDAREGGG